MMLIEQTTLPQAALPVAEFRDHLRLGSGFPDDGLQDGVLESCLRSALAAIEARTGKALIERQFLLSITAWREPGWHPIPVAPVSGVVSLQVLDRAGTPTLVNSDGYSLRQDPAAPRIEAAATLPIIPSGGGAELVFVAGFGPDWTHLPDDLLRAVYMLAASFYENRYGGAVDGAALPPAVELLIGRYRAVRITGGGV